MSAVLTLRGRIAANLRTAEIHPDPAARERAKVRAAGYQVALGDVMAAAVERVAADHRGLLTELAKR